MYEHNSRIHILAIIRYDITETDYVSNSLCPKSQFISGKWKQNEKKTPVASGFYASGRYVLHKVQLRLEYMYVCMYACVNVCTFFQAILLRRIFTSCFIDLYCFTFITNVYHTEKYLQLNLGKDNLWIVSAVINPLQTKIIPTYLKIRSVPSR